MHIVFPVIRLQHIIPSTGQGCYIDIRLMPDVVMTGDGDAMTDFWSQEGNLGMTAQPDLGALPRTSIATIE